jgi:preprotein translocase subunit SecA
MFNVFNEDERKLRKIEKRAQKVMALEKKYKEMNNDELKAQTGKLKERLANGETLNDIYADAFAVAREAAYRVVGEFAYPVQIVAGTVVHEGDIAELKTGEGKTLTGIMPLYLNALEGKGVHIVTVNEYLSERDRERYGCILEWLGLTVGFNKAGLPAVLKRKAYECDVTYTTNSELGFDYLRDNMVLDTKERVLRGLNFALIDEADSILIDESRTPLIISGGEKNNANLYLQVDRFVKKLKKDSDFEIDVRSKTVALTDDGIAKAEKAFNITNLYGYENSELLHFLTNALRANYIMEKDVDYMVNTKDDEILIIDPNTGRLMKGRQWSDGLHQAVEAKEGISIKQETVTRATITYQNFFRLYNKLSGMTGTAKTDEEEFLETYNMFVVCVPTNRPVIRLDHTDIIYGSRKAKYEGIIEEVKRRHAMGQPVLVGTIAVETSEEISKMMDRAHIPHNTLNAKNHAKEAEIIAHAGEKGAVTIATNMAGRGTDIKLGEGVKELGGLCIIGSERHESRRIDNQLRGRAGRQGDPGESQFFISTEDNLVKRFGSEHLEKMFEKLGDEVIESKTVARSIESAQKRVEGVNYDARKNLMQYDDVMRQQRESFYEERNYVLEHSDIHEMVKTMFDRSLKDLIRSVTDENGNIDGERLEKVLNKYGVHYLIKQKHMEGLNAEDLRALCLEKCWSNYEKKISSVREQAIRVERYALLNLMDNAWVNHIDAMNSLKSGISLRSYAQANPIQAYVSEGFQLYEHMMLTISRDMMAFCMHLKVTREGE